MNYIVKWLTELGLEENYLELISNIVLIVVIALVSLLGNFIAKKVILKIVARNLEKGKFKLGKFLLKRKFFERGSLLIAPLIINGFAASFPTYQTWIQRIIVGYLIVIILLMIDSFLNGLDDFYRTYEISNMRPIKGFLQVIKIVVSIFGGVLILATVIGESPVILLSGIGALTAVLTLIFKDSILGLVAGIQLASNDMVRIGDWIDMPKYQAEGVVIDISLNTIKVRNFDQTISTIPAYALISDSFKNWRGMFDAGGRRIKRSIYIDINSVTFLTDEMIHRYKQIHYLKDYIQQKEGEISQYNAAIGIDGEDMINGRRLTNIGTFRAYVSNYVKNHPGINQDMILMVRQLPMEGRGLPLEIYAFTSSTMWTIYENTQSDIFDHLYAVLKEFDLVVFQEPTGKDLETFRNVPERY